jgi:hypothetical protein
MIDKPKWVAPGSYEAQALGCECPRSDNGYGRGYMGQPGIYVMTAGCPVHSPDKAPVPPSGEIKGRKTDRPYTRKQPDAPTHNNEAPSRIGKSANSMTFALTESNRRKTRMGR